jgi:hypothetical protein
VSGTSNKAEWRTDDPSIPADDSVASEGSKEICELLFGL